MAETTVINKIKYACIDIVKTFGIGLLAALVLGAVSALAGLLFGRNGAASALETAKDVLLLAASLGLFLLAGLLLVKGKKPETMQDKEGWRRHFRVLGLKSVAAVLCIAFLAAASAADWLLMRVF